MTIYRKLIINDIPHIEWANQVLAVLEYQLTTHGRLVLDCCRYILTPHIDIRMSSLHLRSFAYSLKRVGSSLSFSSDRMFHNIITRPYGAYNDEIYPNMPRNVCESRPLSLLRDHQVGLWFALHVITHCTT